MNSLAETAFLCWDSNSRSLQTLSSHPGKWNFPPLPLFPPARLKTFDRDRSTGSLSGRSQYHRHTLCLDAIRICLSLDALNMKTSLPWIIGRSREALSVLMLEREKLSLPSMHKSDVNWTIGIRAIAPLVSKLASQHCRKLESCYQGRSATCCSRGQTTVTLH